MCSRGASFLTCFGRDILPSDVISSRDRFRIKRMFRYFQTGKARRGVKRWIKEHRALRYVRLLQPEPRLWGREAGDLPSFLIIGAQRSGSTFLHDRLQQKTSASGSPLQKEIHYFDSKYYRSLAWYARFFDPLEERTGATATFEASPYYLYHPAVPKRIHESLPDVKVVAALRNPVDRTVSQYQWIRDRNLEVRGPEEAFQYDAERLHWEQEPSYLKRFENPLYFDFDHIHYGYLRRSLYHIQLQRWQEWFPPSQIRVVGSQRLFEHPDDVIGELVEFLGLERSENAKHERVNQNSPREKVPVPEEARDIARRHLEDVIARTESVLTDQMILGNHSSLHWT
ncbi:MAG: hypothetical protein BRD55_05605 [Bacteroidetes bacterium SW_9_63_38]|nr:MAG: hypothetical protein BRD55_05605 [Bacteroidetes bacterium SW_9_63_38]